MIPKECKRLAEVDFPIAVVSKHAARDLPAPRRKGYFVYVLKCSDSSFYIGQTNDITRRFAEHEAGKIRWTRSRGPTEMIHWETFHSRDLAVKREQELKTGWGRKWLKREYEAGRLAARQAGKSIRQGFMKLR